MTSVRSVLQCLEEAIRYTALRLGDEAAFLAIVCTCKTDCMGNDMFYDCIVSTTSLVSDLGTIQQISLL